MKTNSKTKCPECGAEIDIDGALMRQFNERMEEHRLSVRKEIEQDSLFRMREKEKIITDLKSQLDEALRKANQSSVQRQGELQEQEIIKILQEAFPTDEIVQSKKGSNGADILQTVKTPEGTICGKIYYESKNTRVWSNDWIPKLKNDNLKVKADALVIITHALPKGIERCGLQEGIWICDFSYFKELSMVLRYTLSKLQSVAITNQGREGKMEQLYSYLSSEEFKSVFESILDGFETIKESHQSEQIILKRMWVKREKVMEQILLNSVEFYGTIRGITGSVIPEIKMLELPQAEN